MINTEMLLSSIFRNIKTTNLILKYPYISTQNTQIVIPLISFSLFSKMQKPPTVGKMTLKIENVESELSVV